MSTHGRFICNAARLQQSLFPFCLLHKYFRNASTSELSYPLGISLLSLKNQLLLSYIHHLVAIFSLKLTSTSLTSAEGTDVVNSLVKLRVVLEKISPLEGKLKYQIEKLVRKADQAAEGADEDDVANGERPRRQTTIQMISR